jgi:hypothetical protein
MNLRRAPVAFPRMAGVRRSARVSEARARAACAQSARAGTPRPTKRARVGSPEPVAEPVPDACPGERLVRADQGVWRAPATVFLDDDLASMCWTPPMQTRAKTPQGRGSGKLGRPSMHNIARPDEVHPYFISRKAANDSARGTVRMFRHIGRVTLAGASLVAAIEQDHILVSSQLPDACNLVHVLEILRCHDATGLKRHQCLRRLAAQSASPWDTPLMLTVCSLAQLRTLRPGAMQTFQIDVFAGRLLFELIANDDIRILFESLEVCTPPSELRALPSYPPTFERSRAPAGEDPYSFHALLRRAESLGFRDLDEKPSKAIDRGLNATLLPFQRQTVQFMLDRENGTFGINDCFWRTYIFTPDASTNSSDGGPLYYFPLAGELRLHHPPVVKGALICEEMGLGKTVEAISLILAQKATVGSFEFTVRRDQLDCNVCDDGSVRIRASKTVNQDKEPQKEPLMRHGDVVLDYSPIHSSANRNQGSDHFRVKRWPARSSLVIAPASLVKQWHDEISQKAPDLSVVEWIWNGDSRTSEDVCVGPHAKDVVLATFESLRYDSRLGKIHWRRLIVDEAQVMRRSMTQIARDALNLRADARFLMTGTPITNSLNDIAGELAFLKIWPFTLENDGFWESRVLLPWQLRRSSLLIDTLLQSSMIRHTKAQPGIGIRLPQRSYSTLHVNLRGSHRAVYCFLWGCMEDELNRLRGDESPDLRNARSLFNLMRTACVSSALVNTFAVDFARRVVWASRVPAYLKSTTGDNEAALDFRTVNPAEALEFIAAAGSRFNRDSTRSFAMTDHEDDLSRYSNMVTTALREEAVAREICRWDTVKRYTRGRLIVLLAGGIHRLDTDTLSELRCQVRDAGLVEVVELATLSRQRAIALLRTHHTLLKSVNGAGSINESGFTALNKLMDGREVPNCPVCMGVCERPSLTRCGHFYCRQCVSLMIQATQSVYKSTRCAICRGVVDFESIVEILVPKSRVEFGRKHNTSNGRDSDLVAGIDELDEEGDAHACVAEAEHGHVEDASERADSWNLLRAPIDGCDGRLRCSKSSSRCTSTVTRIGEQSGSPPSQHWVGRDAWQEYAGLGLANPDNQFLGRNPHTPSLDPSFLQHLRAAQESPPKLEALFELVMSSHADSKFVVVAEAACTLRMIGIWLERKGVECVGVGVETGVLPGRRHSRDASYEFRVNPSKRVFLLNTACASGLTLTAAQYVVFMEPLASKADEIQASARVHRIGQNRPVKIIRIVASDTIEGGILQFRGGSTATEEEEIAALSGTSRSLSTFRMILSIFGREARSGRDSDSTDGDIVLD